MRPMILKHNQEHHEICVVDQIGGEHRDFYLYFELEDGSMNQMDERELQENYQFVAFAAGNSLHKIQEQMRHTEEAVKQRILR